MNRTGGTAERVLDVSDLCISSRLGGSDRAIVRDVNVEVAASETIGIVGESGSGKSMTARALVGLLPQGVQASGSVVYGGANLLEAPERQLRRVRGSGIALILQDPFTMLNPLLRCGVHISESLAPTHEKRSRRDAASEATARLREVGITDPTVAGKYPFQLSGGMRQRVAIAAALAGDPSVVIADEPSTALDVNTQREVLRLLKRIQADRGMALILITHDLRVAFASCDRIYVLYAGGVLETARAADLEREPLHPYSLGLLLSEPPGDKRLRSLPVIAGSVPSPDDVTGRCAFAARCRWHEPVCVSARPRLAAIDDRRATACVRIGEIREAMRSARSTAVAEYVTVELEPAEPLVSVRDLSKVFETAHGGSSVAALAGVSIDVGRGESVGIVGESGSGKTTLGRCIVGLEAPTAGSITVDGLDVTHPARLSAGDAARYRRTVQIVFQDPYSSLNPRRTIGSALIEVLATHGAFDGSVEQARDELLELVGLPRSYRSRKPYALSGGERQRVAIARALAVRPQLLICDEPVSALDVSVQAQILNLLARLRSELGIAYLFITHDLAVVRQIADRAYVMYRGEVVEAGPVGRLLDAPQHAYTSRLVAAIPRSEPEWLLAET